MYDNPINDLQRYAEMDFGAAAGATTHKIAGPAGKKGRLADLGAIITEATVFATTLGHIQVGVTGDLDKFAKLEIATAQDADTVFNSADDTDAITGVEIPPLIPLFL